MKREKPMAEIETSQGVILLHGLSRTRRSMRPVEKRLKREGYLVVNAGYPSRKEEIETLALSVIPDAVERLSRIGAAEISFVTHSMGAILLRWYNLHHPISRIRRVVMLAPPNQGSELVDRLSHYWWFKAFNGPAGCQLGTNHDSLPNRLGPVDFPTGIITGTRPTTPILSSMIPAPNDGKVSVNRAKVEGMDDFMTVPYSHSFVMWHKQVLDLVVAFLRNGRFSS